MLIKLLSNEGFSVSRTTNGQTTTVDVLSLTGDDMTYDGVTGNIIANGDSVDTALAAIDATIGDIEVLLSEI